MIKIRTVRYCWRHQFQLRKLFKFSWAKCISSLFGEFANSIRFAESSHKVNAIFFYNKQRRKEHFATSAGKTSKGIDWNSTEAGVIEAYGQPKEDYSGGFPITWRRMIFEGIDFRFENNVMVRIGIPGK